MGMKHRHYMFKEAICSCGETFDKEIGTNQKLCLTCLKNIFIKKGKNLRVHPGEVVPEIIPGPVLSTLDTDEQRLWFLKRLKEIRKIHSLPNTQWKFSISEVEIEHEEIIRGTAHLHNKEEGTFNLSKKRKFQCI